MTTQQTTMTQFWIWSPDIEPLRRALFNYKAIMEYNWREHTDSTPPERELARSELMALDRLIAEIPEQPSPPAHRPQRPLGVDDRHYFEESISDQNICSICGNHRTALIHK